MKKWLVYAVGLLWVVAAVQFIRREWPGGNDQVIEAVSNLQFSELESSINVSVLLDHNDYTVTQKQQLVSSIAESLGLFSGYEYVISDDENGNAVSLEKTSAYAKTSIKCATTNIEYQGEETLNNYILINLHFYQSPESGIYYKKQVEAVLEQYDVKTSANLNITGIYNGNLDQLRRDTVTEELLTTMNAKEVDGYREEDLYTVYGYTDYFDDYMNINGNKVNVNIAVTYNETEDNTYVYLGSPILTEDY